MLAALFLIGSALCGACVARRVWRGVARAWEQVLWGLVAGWMLGALAAYGFARWQGRLTWGAVAWATSSVWAAAALLSARRLVGLRRGRLEVFGFAGSFGREHVGLAAVLVLFAPVLWALFSTHTFAEGPGGIYSGGSAWYDLSFHAALASSFAYGENFPPAYTPLAGEALRYPFLPDFHAAALMAAGLSMRAAFLWTAVPLALALVGIFYGLALRLADSARAAALATCLFLLNGGLGFLNLLEDWRHSGLAFLDFWNALPFNYANDWARGIHWTNLVTDTLLPQRAALYGLPAGLIVLALFAVVWQQWKDEGGRMKDEADAARPFLHPSSFRLHPLFAAGVLAGLLPLFHTHSYVAVGFVSVVLFLMKPRREWLWFWVPALALAAPQLFELARHAGFGQIVRWQPGWMGSDAPSFAGYAVRNFGVPLLLAVPAWLAAPRAWKSFYVAALLLLVFALTVVVSPNVFDNGKLTYYWHAVNSALVARWLVALARARRLRALRSTLALLLALLSLATGVAALRAEGRASALLFSQTDLAAVRFVREATPPRARFLAAPAFNHPVLALAGRASVRGPTDWLWAHGYEFRARERDVRRIYAGAPDALDLLSYYGVAYVYLGEAERRDLHADESFFEANLPAVYRAGGITVYKVSSTNDVSKPAPRELAARVRTDPYAFIEEFPRVGLFVHRILKAERGRAPAREEFVQALGELGRGLYVGARGWESRLAENRRALAARLAGGDAARAEKLLAAASDENFDAREYDEAYVRAHFFGYLGRDPDAEGFDFWLGVLSRNKDYRSLSRAFMESEEYKRRVLGAGF
ncbi:MAG: DUF4214 domain-containing protein [Acidobacteria bacterium]|nr:DUF4214 domain-containing protein [Acidobacteriota bacterium]